MITLPELETIPGVVVKETYPDIRDNCSAYIYYYDTLIGSVALGGMKATFRKDKRELITKMLKEHEDAKSSKEVHGTNSTSGET